MSVTSTSPHTAMSSWLAGFDQAYTQMDSTPLPRGLLRLKRWPELGEIPEMLLGPVVRICALLWCKPTASYLVARTLGTDNRQTEALLQLLQRHGYVDLLASGASGSDAPHALDAAAPPPSHGLLGKLWQRLLG